MLVMKGGERRQIWKMTNYKGSCKGPTSNTIHPLFQKYQYKGREEA
jgi:hypothetical protein